jgi:hypothetical protein
MFLFFNEKKNDYCPHIAKNANIAESAELSTSCQSAYSHFFIKKTYFGNQRVEIGKLHMRTFFFLDYLHLFQAFLR